MEIGLSNASFYPNVNTEESIQLIKNLGFDTAEIFLNTLSEFEDDFVNILIEQKNKHNLKINSVHGFSSAFEPYLFDDYERRRKDMLCLFKKVCIAGKKLGANCYTFHGMRLIDSVNMNYKRNVEIFNELAYCANEIGIKLALENVSWCMSSKIDYLNFIKQECKYPVYFTIDIKQAYKANIEPVEYLKVMGNRLVNVHLNDRDEQNTCLLPGRGKVDIGKFIEELRNINYSGNMIIEVYSSNYKEYNEIQKSKEYVSKLLYYNNFK